jgi:hypothetical protein
MNGGSILYRKGQGQNGREAEAGRHREVVS